MNKVNLLKQHHLKTTPQRAAIIELMESAGHISIENLYPMIKLKFASISLATLYKNIHAMMENNLIREVKIPGYKSRYEIVKEPHAHMLCKECGELKDFSYDSSVLMDEAVNKSDYKAEEVSVVVSGICPKCQKGIGSSHS